MVAICLYKVLSSKKMTISLVCIEFTGASVLVAVLLGISPSGAVYLTMLMISLFVCEGVLALSLLGIPLMQGGPTPKELSSSLLYSEKFKLNINLGYWSFCYTAFWILKSMLGFHPFHMVSASPWPFVGSMAVMSLSGGLVSFLVSGAFYPLIVSLISVSLVALLWWRDVVREATGMGCHSGWVVSGLQLGMILFIISEIMFFFSLFFGWFFIMLSPDPSMGCSVPPVGVQPLSFTSVPLLNTVILLSSGVSITWSHHSILENKSGFISLMLTCTLGGIFLIFQCIEYYEIPFSISDSVYGSLFFMATGFHGFHVLIGTSFLLVNLLRSAKGHFTSAHHLGFESAAWYWHFVDVVWLFLFISVYWWGS